MVTTYSKRGEKKTRRINCPVPFVTKLKDPHDSLCHPEVTPMTNFFRTESLPHSIAEMKSVTACCNVCAQIKLAPGHLIKETHNC